MKGERENLTKKLITVFLFLLLLINSTSISVNVSASSINQDGMESSAGLSEETGKNDFDTQNVEAEENTTKTEESHQLNSTYLGFSSPYLNKSDLWRQLAFGDENHSRIVIGIRNYQKNFLNELVRLTESFNGRIVNEVSIQNVTIAIVSEVPTYYTSTFMEAARTRNFVSYIQPSMKFKAMLTPNDPYWNAQWGPAKMEADWAWNTTIGDPSVLVAVVDTGIYYLHEDLIENYVPLGYDWVNLDSDPMDDNGHGTHVAGIIAATLNNAIGIAGLAQVMIMAEKALDSWGYGYDDWLANAIIHATDQGADIISMSWGAYAQSPIIYQAIKYAYDSGVLLVAAAGNEGVDTKLYPAGYKEVIAVAATDRNDQRPWWSNYGDWIELAAPGVDVYSTVPWGYTYASGTSMSTPHVSGVAALILSLYPNASRDWLRYWLHYTADDIGDPGFDRYYGYGRVNARKAVEEPLPVHELLISSWEPPPYVEPESTARVNVTVTNFGSTDETEVNVELIVNNTLIDMKVIESIPRYASFPVTLQWNPVLEGVYNLTCYVVPVENETDVQNNAVSRYVYVGFPVKAVVLQSAGNILSNIIANWQVLNAQWMKFGDQMIYIDYTTLNKDSITYEDIAATEADVLIISCACSPYYGWEFKDSEIEAITQYVKEGHGLIATAGTLYHYVPNNNKLAPLFGLKENLTWYATWTDLLHIINASHPIFGGVPNPLVFSEVGTALPRDGEWDSDELVDGEYLALGHYLESAIVARRGLIYIAPWLEIIPAYYHHHLQLLYNAIVWSRYQKPLHEISVSLEAPFAVKPNSTAIINATVYNLGRSNETNVELMILINSIPVGYLNIPTLNAGSNETLSYVWTPTIQSTYNVTAYVPPILDEDDVKNNVKSAKVSVYTYMVAIVKNNDPWEYPANEYALSTYNVPYVIVNSAEFGSFDLGVFSKVVIASDQDQTFYNNMESYKYWFEDYVTEGGTLEIHAADRGWHRGEWIGPLPGGLSWAPYYSDYVTIIDYTHPIVRFPHEITDSELDYWRSSVHGYFITYPTGTHIIIIEDISGYPAYVEFSYGNGTILATSQTIEWGYMHHYSLILENSILYYRFIHEIAIELEAPSWVPPGTSTSLNVTVYNLGVQAETNVTVYMHINGTIITKTNISRIEVGQSVLIPVKWRPQIIGKYNITAHTAPVSGEAIPLNNRKTIWLNVRPPVLVLFDQTHRADSIEYYSTWIGTLAKNGFVIETHTSGQLTSEKLTQFDILVLPQPREYYNLSEIYAIQDFVNSGGGLFLIGDNEPAIYTSITEFAGITWDWEYYWWRGYTDDITLHPVTEDVEKAFFSSPISQLFVSSPAVDLIRDGAGYGEVMFAVSRVGRGKVVCIADENSIDNYDITYADNMRLAINTMNWLYRIPEYDINIKLEVPSFVKVNSTVIINATVTNRGLHNASDIKLSLYINGSKVAYKKIDFLKAGWINITSYIWRPEKLGVYNLTAYASPVLNEERISNNKATAYVTVLFKIPRVAVLNSWDRPSYFYGGWHNDYETLVDALVSKGLYAEPITNEEIIIGALSSFDVFVMVDNVPNDAAVPYVVSFWNRGGGVIAFDSSICFLCYAGILPPESAGSNGHYTYWDYNTWYEAKVSRMHPVTKGYKVGQIIYGTAGDAEYNVDALKNTTAYPYYTKLVEDVERSNRAYVSAYEPPAGGRVVHIWDRYQWKNTDIQLMILNAIIWTRARVHDLCVRAISAEPTQLYVGQPVSVNVTVANEGETAETFTLELYYENASLIKQTAGAVLSIPSEPHRANATWIEPSYIDLTSYTPREKFSVKVWLNLSSPSFAWQIMLTYNSTILNATAAGYTAGSQSEFFQGLTTLPLSPAFGDINATCAYVMVGETLIGPDQRDPGFGSLCWIEFEIVNKPTGQYLGHLIFDPVETFVLDPDLNDVSLQFYEGVYGFGIIPPSPPTPGLIGSALAQLQPGEIQTFTFVWNTSGVKFGNYTIKAFAVPVLGELETEDNLLVDGVVQVIWRHDVAVTGVKPYRYWVYTGGKLNFNVTVENRGDFEENVTVKIYYNFTANQLIDTYTIQNLNPGENTTINFVWNTSSVEPCRNYTITAIAYIEKPDSNPSDNMHRVVKVKVRILGDINGDNKVDIRDVSTVAIAFGSYPEMPKWNPDADINFDGKVDIRDVVLVASNFGKCG